MTRDRLAALLDPGSGLNGIDYVEVVPGNPPTLLVHFLTPLALSGAALTARIDGGDAVRTIPLAPIAPGDWSVDAAGRPQLALHPQAVGDFSTYTLHLEAAALDAQFRTAPVSFKLFCPSKVDCAPLPEECPPDAVAIPAIDYLAKDFASFRRALLDDAAQRYPNWVERAEADLGMVMAEALAALADELSYQQDRAAADLSFATAVSHQTLAAHARLVDYEPEPARIATCELLLRVAATTIPAGTRIDGIDGDGARIAFEIGQGLAGPAGYAVDPAANWPLTPWWWSDDTQCLTRGATGMWLVDASATLGAALHKGDRLLIQTDLDGETIRQIVTLSDDPTADHDPLFPPGTGTDLVRIAWAEPLTRDRDLARTTLGGNVLPALQSVRRTARFAIAPVPATAPGAVQAIEREGPDGLSVQRLPLADAPLAWRNGSGEPEIRVRQIAPDAHDWHHARTLLDADPLERAYTVDREGWRAVTHAGDGRPTHWEPDGDDGATIRFGDGVFGIAPEPGAVFDVVYGIGAGAAGNLPADAITDVGASATILEARNPLPARGGSDAETALRIRRSAPQAYRQRPLRAVRAADHVAAARELPWVQDAGARFRWTGSWHSLFVAADPVGGFDPGPVRQLELERLIDRRRMAGVEAFAPAPRFVSIDLEIDLCIAATARRDDVARRVLAALTPGGREGTGFFFADRFTFGTPLYRARLEAAIAAVAGVKGVLDIRFRRRAQRAGYQPLPALLPLGAGEILRIDNDPDWPERGTITILTEGGA